MKTLCFTDTNVSAYLFDDATPVEVTSENTIVGQPVEFFIGDMKSTTATLYDNVTAPSDWVGHKYLFDGQAWTINPDYKPFEQTT
jgi:hypothetical protein